jgi:hypothetical protein
LDLQESELRRVIASNIITTFCWINGAVFLFILLVFISDAYFIAKGILPSSDRSIDSKVIISMIGATTIQLGAIAFSLSQWLFPKNERQPHGSVRRNDKVDPSRSGTD